MHRLVPFAAAGLAASLMAVAPASGDVISGHSGGWSFRGAVKGLVTVTQNDADVTLAFNLFGLRANTKYRLVASSRRCGASGGRMFARAFTSDPRGTSWDPVTFRADASRIKSFSLRERKSGTTVACSGKAAIHVGADNTGIKVARPKAVVMTSEANALWVLMTSVTGLEPNTRYRAAALPGGCVPGAKPLFTHGFRSNAQGNALVRAQRDATAASPISSVAVVERASGKVVFCAGA
ncbi:MAG: hypothetical protein IPG68_01880 [Micrococcales bacterium]|nr:hypothetical protein [Micrococcales bacterium]